MRSFLKNNLIAILVCLGALTSLSFATTITRPYGPSDYAGGQKAVGSKVNAEFQSIVDWLNGGNIASGNIAASGVITANIADGAVTNVKRGAANYAVTTSSSLFSNTAALAQVTNLSTSITTYGRPVLVRLEAANSSYLISNISTTRGEVYSSDSSGAGSYITVLKNSSTLAKQRLPYQGASGENRHPCSAYTVLDAPTAGTYTYSVGVESNTGVTGYVSGCKLTVTEF